MMRQNHYNLLRSEIQSTQHDLDRFNQMLREEMTNIRTEIAIDINNRRTEIREEIQRREMNRQLLNHKLNVLCSDVKHQFETMKFESTRDVVARASVGVFIVFLSLYAFKNLQPNEVIVEEVVPLLEQ